jgi:hypothetical protein
MWNRPTWVRSCLLFDGEWTTQDIQGNAPLPPAVRPDRDFASIRPGLAKITARVEVGMLKVLQDACRT